MNNYKIQSPTERPTSTTLEGFTGVVFLHFSMQYKKFNAHGMVQHCTKFQLFSRVHATPLVTLLFRSSVRPTVGPWVGHSGRNQAEKRFNLHQCPCPPVLD